MKTLYIVHVFYPEFWPEIAACLRNIDGPTDLIVTYVDETKGIPEMVRRDFPAARCILCENRGFDIWPFLKALQTVNISDYSILVKLHTKRDVKRDGRLLVFNHCDFSENAWRNYLLGFVRDAEAWRQTKARLALEGVGMVADRHVILRRDDTPWFGTRYTMDRALALVEELYGFSARKGAQFVAGTMFAARPSVFAKLRARGWSADDFVQSVHDNTEQMAHVLERALGVIVSAVAQNRATMAKLDKQSELADAHGLRSTSFGSNESDRCPSCQVTAIVDNAQIQAQMFGLFD